MAGGLIVALSVWVLTASVRGAAGSTDRARTVIGWLVARTGTTTACLGGLVLAGGFAFAAEPVSRVHNPSSAERFAKPSSDLVAREQTYWRRTSLPLPEKLVFEASGIVRVDRRLLVTTRRGEVWWVEVASERLGLPTDPFVLVQRVSGEGPQERLEDVAEFNDIPSPIKPSKMPCGAIRMPCKSAYSAIHFSSAMPPTSQGSGPTTLTAWPSISALKFWRR